MRDGNFILLYLHILKVLEVPSGIFEIVLEVTMRDGNFFNLVYPLGMRDKLQKQFF
jgi:DNA-binding cell septation regulator SpoVG